MATPVINNGIFLRETELAIGSTEITKNHMMNLLTDIGPMDLGPVDIWAMQQKVEMPLYSMSNFGGKNIILVDNARGEYKWEIPTVQDMPFIINDIDSSNTRKGIDGQTFRMLFNRKDFGHGAIISYDKYTGAEVFITGDPIISRGDGYIYTCRLVNNDNTRYLDNAFLASNTRWFRKGSVKGEYDQKYDSIVTRSGFREFYNYVGTGKAHCELHVSEGAVEIMGVPTMTSRGTVPILEMWNYSGNMDPSIVDLKGLRENLGGAAGMKKAMAQGKLTNTFLTKVEAACLTKIGNDIETYLMWGKGGRVSGDGIQDSRLTTGLWDQLNNSYLLVYNKLTFSLDMFRSQIYNFFRGKVDFTGPDPMRQISIQTGMGGMKLVAEAIKREGIGSGLVLNATDIGAVTGKGMSLGFGYAFQSFVIPYLANVTFVINPAFDNVHNNPIENPNIDGFPLSSYSFIVFDVTNNTTDNIKLLKCASNYELKWRYINGTSDYMGRSSGFNSAGNFSGWKLYMEQRHQALWVKDPTKLLKIVMKNPKTGGHL